VLKRTTAYRTENRGVVGGRCYGGTQVPSICPRSAGCTFSLLAAGMGCSVSARPVADVRPPGRGSIPCGGPLCALYRRRRDRHETPAAPTTRRLHDGLRVALRLVGILPIRPAAALLGHMQRDGCTLVVGRRISPNVNRRGLSSPFQARDRCCRMTSLSVPAFPLQPPQRPMLRHYLNCL
jgi:hypothetical protein